MGHSHKTKNLIYENGVLMCPECGMTWSNIILDDEDIYDESITETYNFLVAFEYFKLKKMIESGQIYGALFQIKDIYEILLRLPVLIFASYLHSQKSIDEENKKLLITLTIKKHSLGDWRSYLNQVSKQLKTHENIYDALNTIVEKTLKFANMPGGTGGVDIVHWRNEIIGHGATMLSGDLDMYTDIEKRITDITAFLLDLEDEYAKVVFCVKGKEQNYFVGYNNILDVTEQELNISIANKGIAFPAVYFRIFENGIYMYDSYISKKQLMDMIEFPKGKRELFMTNHFDELIERMPSTTKSSINDDIYYQEEKEIGEKVLNVEDFVEPVFLTDWLKKIIESNTKISMIQMEKGMGKSTFIRALDPFAIGKVKLPGTSIRAYYINSSFGSKLFEFSNTMYERFSLDDDGNKRIAEIAHLDTKSDDPQKAFADMLNEIKATLFCSVNLLFIIDGLDELKKQEGRNIADYIPNDPNLLHDGIFLLVTSRTFAASDGLSGYNRECLDRLNSIPRYKLDLLSPEYIDFKKQYLVNNIFGFYFGLFEKNHIEYDISKANTDEIIESLKCENMLYIKQYQELVSLKINNEMILGAKKINSDVFRINRDSLEEYFFTIKSKYGEKYYNKFIKIIMVLVISNDYLTIDDLANLVDNGHADFAFLAFINSIRMFLTALRSPRGNVFRVSHLEIANYVKNNLRSNLDSTIDDMFSTVTDFTRDFIFEYNDSQTMVFLAYLYETMTTAKEAGLDIYQTIKSYMEALVLRFPLYMDWGLSDPQVDWCIKFFQGLKSFYLEELNDGQDKYRIAFYKILAMLGFWNYMKQFFAQGRACLEEAFKIADSVELPKNEYVYRYIDFTGVLLYCYQELGLTEKGYALLNNSRAKIDELISSKYPVSNKSLGVLDQHFSSLYYSDKKYKEAFEILRKSLNNYEVGKTNVDIWDYSHMHQVAGKCAMAAGMLNEAEYYLTKGYEIKAELIDSTGYVKTYIDRYKDYKALGELKIMQGDYQSALLWQDKNILMMESLDANNELTNKTFYLDILYAKGQLEIKMAKIKEAKETIAKALYYYDHLEDEEKNKISIVKTMKKFDSLKEKTKTIE